MKLYCLLIFILLLPCLLLGQSKKRAYLPPPNPPSKKQLALAEKHEQCFNSHRYTVAKRRSFLPFNKAVSIRLISFSAPEPNSPIRLDNEPSPSSNSDKDTLALFTPIAPNLFHVNYHKVKENISVTPAGIDSLTDIMYNIGETPVKGLVFEIADPGYSCYNPRNAILFLDAKNRVTHYVEICFECHRYYFSSGKMKSISYCAQKIDMLKQYFLTRGVQYGTILLKHTEE